MLESGQQFVLSGDLLTGVAGGQHLHLHAGGTHTQSVTQHATSTATNLAVQHGEFTVYFDFRFCLQVASLIVFDWIDSCLSFRAWRTADVVMTQRHGIEGRGPTWIFLVHV